MASRFIRQAVLPGLALSGALLAGGDAAEGAIIVGNTAVSGEIIGAASNPDAGSISFNNNGEFLAVVVVASAHQDSAIAENSTATVSYGGTPLTAAVTYRRNGGSGWVGIFYLANPTTGSATLSVQFNGDAVPADNGAWQFAVLSLSGVDEANPLAMTKTWIGSGTTTETLASPTPGAISAGDLLLVASASDNSVSGVPHYTTPAGSQVNLFTNDAPAGAGNREYSALYAPLVAGDLSSGDQVVITTGTQRARAAAGVVFNAVPEPASLALLGFGGLLLGRRRMVDR